MAVEKADQKAEWMVVESVGRKVDMLVDSMDYQWVALKAGLKAVQTVASKAVHLAAHLDEQMVDLMVA